MKFYQESNFQITIGGQESGIYNALDVKSRGDEEKPSFS